jgi:tRNA pseudouridine55 synthase
VENRIDGVIIIDKPADISSAGVVSRIKRALGAKKAGHAGTLDPFATGILVCGLNQGTRLARFFLKGDKTYRAMLLLGIETDTQDATGTVTASGNPEALTETEIRAVLDGFEGEIEQVPPVFSALKHNGVPLYKLARSGKPVQKPPRRVEISRIAVRRIELPRVEFDVSCSAGTYVRTLCADIGKRLGCGGHLETLRRIASSGFSIDESIPLATVEDPARSKEVAARVFPLAEALRGMPAYTAGPGLLETISFGRPIRIEQIPVEPGPSGHIKIVDVGGRLAAVVSRAEGRPHYTYCGVFTEN